MTLRKFSSPLIRQLRRAVPGAAEQLSATIRQSIAPDIVRLRETTAAKSKPRSWWNEQPGPLKG